jgi:hypothetical protein
MRDLATFQRDVACALLSEGQPAPPFRSHAFAVYRNTSARGAVEALRAAFPTVDMLLGEDMFTQVALDYRRERPPASPVLSEYGADFSCFLARQSWTCELPYLADVAMLDRLWLESFLAADHAPSPGAAFRGDTARIMLHPATRYAWLETPAMTIWQAHHQPDELADFEPEWQPEGALFTRRGQQVRAELIDQAWYRLLVSCATPSRVDDCVTAVAAAFPEADVPKLLASCVASGALIIQ